MGGIIGAPNTIRTRTCLSIDRRIWREPVILAGTIGDRVRAANRVTPALGGRNAELLLRVPSFRKDEYRSAIRQNVFRATKPATGLGPPMNRDGIIPANKPSE